MVFWILTAAAIVLIPLLIIVNYKRCKERYGVYTLGRKFQDAGVRLAIVTIVWAFFAFPCLTVFGAFAQGGDVTLKSTESQDLVATSVSTPNSVYSNVFATYNSSGNQTISYTQKNDDGSFSFKSVNSSAAKVYEDDKTSPHIKIDVNSLTHTWLTPFPHSKFKTYSLYVPEGSVVQNSYSMGE